MQLSFFLKRSALIGEQSLRIAACVNIIPASVVGERQLVGVVETTGIKTEGQFQVWKRLS